MTAACCFHWVADHTNVYSGLWLLYSASKMFLLPVPVALYTLTRHFGGRESRVAAPSALFRRPLR